MNDNQFLAVMTAIEHQLKRIADGMAGSAAPNYQRPIEDFKVFDWASIGADVVKADEFGPAIVEADGRTYTRRSPQNKFGAAIWFSRSTGKGEDGNVTYERLITFKPLGEDIEPISREAEKLVQNGKKQAPAPASAKRKPMTAEQQRQREEEEAARLDFERSIKAGPPPPDDDGEFESLQRAVDTPEVQAALAEQKRKRKPEPPGTVLSRLAGIEQEKARQFDARKPAHDKQYGLWCGLVNGIVGEDGRRALTAYLAGVPVREVEAKGWRPSMPQCAAWLDWVVELGPDGKPVRPYTVDPVAGEELRSVLARVAIPEPVFEVDDPPF